jgi:hypothetical protein
VVLAAVQLVRSGCVCGFAALQMIQMRHVAAAMEAGSICTSAAVAAHDIGPLQVSCTLLAVQAAMCVAAAGAARV